MPLDTSVLAVIETLYEFLDRSPAAIVLLDGQQRVVFANGQAADLHIRADGITICSSGIGLLRAPDNARLQGVIARSIRYTPAVSPNDAKGIGKVQARSADPQFVLRPGESRQATLGQVRVMRGTPTATVIGSSYTFDVSIAELEVIYNGQQVRTVREHTLTFPGFALTGGAGATAAGAGSATAPQSGAEAAENIKKAGEAIRGIFGGRKK
jgi:PAS domain-containing protein